MQPYHSGLSPETAPAPYTVKTDHISYRLGEEVKVQIQAPASTPFIGFLLQAREVGGRSPVGSFALTTGATQLLPCSQKPGSIISADCGVTKLCFSHPSNCNPRANAKCYFMSAMMLPLTAAAIRYEMTGPSDGYVSFGFSDDQMMGNDDIYICGIGSDGVVQLQHSFSTGQTTPQAVPLGNISDVRASVLDGVISCSFTSINIISTQRTTGFNKTYYLLFAYGPNSNAIFNTSLETCHVPACFKVSTIIPVPKKPKITGLMTTEANRSVDDAVNMALHFFLQHLDSPGTYARILFVDFSSAFNTIIPSLPHLQALSNTWCRQIQFHTGTFISSDKVDISRPRIVRKAGWPHIIKAHGALMLTAWMTLGSLGMMVARYLKELTKRQKLCGKDIWFLVHVAVMSVTIAATIIAFILSFSYVKAWSGGAHPVLGCLVIILSLLQPILALLRCGPQHPRRFLFNWCHALNGVSIKVLAVAAILTGLKMIDSSLDQLLMKVMGGLVGWEALCYILLEVHLKWKFNSAGDTRGSTQDRQLTADLRGTSGRSSSHRATHGLLTGYSRATHGLLTGYSRATHGLLTNVDTRLANGQTDTGGEDDRSIYQETITGDWDQLCSRRDARLWAELTKNKQCLDNNPHNSGLFYFALCVCSWMELSTNKEQRTRTLQDILESKMTTVDVLLMALFFLGNLTFLVTLLVGIGMS
ncbi:putative ferric-chelate reductase 1 [Cyclopterus lumpus]|uniref:putative ferric-chelate reductase 1 n=1 Tax=Cyclopterus lumpus TaxID=8103 RepID=UPI0014867183|nr:putative ferric-chelate reductase 1 [Cyclopterus lumpus]